MAFQEHYHEVLEVIDKMFLSIFAFLEDHQREHVDLIRSHLPGVDAFVYRKDQSLVLDFREAIELLRAEGIDAPDLKDPTTVMEKALGRIVKEKYGTDFFILNRYPAAARPFYTMPAADNPVSVQTIPLVGVILLTWCLGLHKLV